ncbi:MAG: LCP family protein [Butyrivibrio sp.]|uniref:LCP family protein n=1 Tax=Butyrivibrio sp. TaxID=28121 RepID=UPI001B0EA835|nr:LCP family protein [Butyrivibrio sp.]MBO6239748.1 LCP family protein [Butyrivibrio sp.]
MRGAVKVFLIIWAVLMTITTLGLAGFEVMRIFGKTNLDSKSATSTPMMAQTDTAVYEDTSATWEDDWITYDGNVYDYNDDITTFLIMGIDKDDDTVVKVAEGTDGGQADALFLLVLDPHDQSIKIIGINRNSMTNVDVYDEFGRYQTTVIAQLATQHGFGDGMEESCGYQVKAVSNMFYQLPIHGYAAINMSAIPIINDQVGGVDVTVLEDLTKWDKTLKKGAQVHLEGDSAFYYVKSRDVSVFGSNENRLERQRQYLEGFIEAAKETTKENNNAAVELFSAISSKMVTNITADEISYLAPLISNFEFDSEDIITIKGENVKNGKFEEFYVDDDDLYKTIIDVFYEKVDAVD